MPVGYTTVTSQYLQDATGTVITGATAIFQPVSSVNGQPICFRAGGNGGATSYEQVSVEVNDGALTIQLCDTELRFPANIGYSLSLRDDTTRCVLLYYPCIQPTGATWSLDTYDPVYPSTMVTIQAGPPGTPGAPGSIYGTVLQQVPSGGLDGINVTFTVSGTPAIPMLFRNGVLQAVGTDYTYAVGSSSSTITFAVASVPVPGDTLNFVGISSTAPSGSGSMEGFSSANPATAIYLTDIGTNPAYAGQVHAFSLVNGALEQVS